MEKFDCLFEVKSLDAEQRIIEGFATTPTTDHVGDIVEPRGGKFKLPVPLFGLKHYVQGGDVVGNVTKARVTDEGIWITAQIPKNSGLDYVEKAWLQIKAGLLRGLSIGFRSDEPPGLLKGGGKHYKAWNLVEVTAVPIPMNGECSIAVVKSLLDSPRASLSGNNGAAVDLFPSAVAAQPALSKGLTMPSFTETLSAAEKKRDDLAVQHKAALDAVLATGKTFDDEQQVEQSKALDDIEKLDAHIDFLKRSESTLAKAKPITASKVEDGGDVRKGIGYITITSNKEKGIAFAQALRCLYQAGGVRYIAAEIASKMYRDDPRVAMVWKAEVPAAATISGNWGADFVTTDGGPFQEFLEYVRPLTIIGRLPGSTSVEFLKPVGVQTGGGEGYWVGEGKAKPLTSFAATPTFLPPTKVANIVAVTEEWLKYASANNDQRIRDSMAGALQQRLDTDFVDPAKTLDSGVSPASITNGAATQASAGNDHADIITDFKYMMSVVSTQGIRRAPVLITDSSTALALSMMINTFGQRIFPDVTMTGGTFVGGIPIVVSDSVPHSTSGGMAILVNAPEILVADEGGFDIALSRDASLQMTDTDPNTDMDSVTPNPASGTGLVSMFQTNSVAFRAERAIGWLRARTTAVAYVTAVQWGSA